MSHPSFDSCTSWQEIAIEHRKTLVLPSETVSKDPQLVEWIGKANVSLDPPSNDTRGPSLASLVAREPNKAIWRSNEKLDSVITKDLDATGIIELTRSGKALVRDVTQLFVNRASIVHQATNCLSHFFAKEALERAVQLDEKRAQYEKEGRIDELGHLFGLPITIKGHLAYNKHGSQRGFVFDVLPDPASHPLVKCNLTPRQVELLAKTQGGYVSEAPSTRTSFSCC